MKPTYQQLAAAVRTLALALDAGEKYPDKKAGTLVAKSLRMADAAEDAEGPPALTRLMRIDYTR